MPLHYLYFNYLTTLQANTQNNLGFSHTLPAAHAVWPNTQNWAWFGSQISAICCELSGGGFVPRTPHQWAPGPRWGTSVPQTICVPPTSKSWLRHCLLFAPPGGRHSSARGIRIVSAQRILQIYETSHCRFIGLRGGSGPCLAGVRLTRKALDGFKNRITNWSANDA